MLGMAIFVALNCFSYRGSGYPYLSEWHLFSGPNPSESFGAPLNVLSAGGCIAFYMGCSWLNLFGNAALAVAATIPFVVRLPRGWPPIWWLTDDLLPFWRDQSREFRYSLSELMFCVTGVCVLLGVGMASPYCGLVVRNVVCLVCPFLVYGWLCYRRQVTWWRIIAAGIGLTLIALMLELHYQDWPRDGSSGIFRWLTPFFDLLPWSDEWSPHGYFDRFFVYVMMVRTIAPVFEILLSLAAAHAMRDIIRTDGRRISSKMRILLFR